MMRLEDLLFVERRESTGTGGDFEWRTAELATVSHRKFPAGVIVVLVVCDVTTHSHSHDRKD
jgi:hypothetical protein